MNKTDLVNKLTEVLETKKQAQAALDCVISSIAESLEKGETVSLVGFGSFKVDQRAARKGRNPMTGEEIEIKAKRVPKFVAGKSLKDVVNKQ
jgi:DNA-binding protein HU-beta